MVTDIPSYDEGPWRINNEHAWALVVGRLRRWLTILFIAGRREAHCSRGPAPLVLEPPNLKIRPSLEQGRAVLSYARVPGGQGVEAVTPATEIVGVTQRGPRPSEGRAECSTRRVSRCHAEGVSTAAPCRSDSVGQAFPGHRAGADWARIPGPSAGLALVTHRVRQCGSLPSDSGDGRR